MSSFNNARKSNDNGNDNAARIDNDNGNGNNLNNDRDHDHNRDRGQGSSEGGSCVGLRLPLLLWPLACRFSGHDLHGHRRQRAKRVCCCALAQRQHSCRGAKVTNMGL